jgi:hypothetical protein
MRDSRRFSTIDWYVVQFSLKRFAIDDYRQLSGIWRPLTLVAMQC